MKKGIKIRIILLVLLFLVCITAAIVKIIFLKEVTRFDAKYVIDKPNFCSFSKESFIEWSRDENIRNKFDVSGVEEDLKDLDDDQRLMVSFGSEISFFYRIRLFEHVQVKYKNDKVSNKVYVYIINYDGTITDYNLD